MFPAHKSTFTDDFQINELTINNNLSTEGCNISPDFEVNDDGLMIT